MWHKINYYSQTNTGTYIENASTSKQKQMIGKCVYNKRWKAIYLKHDNILTLAISKKNYSIQYSISKKKHLLVTISLQYIEGYLISTYICI